MDPALSTYERPMSRALQLFLTCFGLLLGLLVVGSTLAALAITDHLRARPAVPVTAVASPAPVPAPDPVQAAQSQADALVTAFAQSVGVEQRRQLLAQIQQLAATPGVTLPYR